MLTRFVFLGLLLLLSSVWASAQEPSDELYIVTNWQPPIEKCNKENTKTVTLETLLSSPEVYLGHCVSTEGFYRARAIFIKKRDLRRKYPASNKRNANRRVGIYANETQLEKLQKEDGKLLKLSGVVSDCSELHGENVIMVMGYCHHTSGPFIGLLPE